MQQSTACFMWRTTSLRVGGRAARRTCLSGLRRGRGGRQAGATVLSCLVWRCELTAGQVRSASECVRRSHCAARHTPTQTRRRTHLSDCRADSVHTATPDATKQSCLCRVGRGGVSRCSICHCSARDPDYLLTSFSAETPISCLFEQNVGQSLRPLSNSASFQMHRIFMQTAQRIFNSTDVQVLHIFPDRLGNI